MHDDALSMTRRPGDQFCACAGPVGAGMAGGLPVPISYQNICSSELSLPPLPAFPPHSVPSPSSFSSQPDCWKVPSHYSACPCTSPGIQGPSFLPSPLSCPISLSLGHQLGCVGATAFLVHSLNRRQALLGFLLCSCRD